jgi:hypothetical protein
MMPHTANAAFRNLQRRNPELRKIALTFIGLRWSQRNNRWVRKTHDGWRMDLAKVDERWHVVVKSPLGSKEYIYQ